jgi:hypothetical protein
MPGLGTAINVGTIVAGTGVGLLVGGRLPERARATVLNGVGLVVLALGVTEAARTHNIVFPLVSIVLGGLIGEALGIEERLASVGDRIRRRVSATSTPTPIWSRSRGLSAPKRDQNRRQGARSSRGSSPPACCSASAPSPSSARSTTACRATSSCWR